MQIARSVDAYGDNVESGEGLVHFWVPVWRYDLRLRYVAATATVFLFAVKRRPLHMAD